MCKELCYHDCDCECKEEWDEERWAFNNKYLWKGCSKCEDIYMIDRLDNLDRNPRKNLGVPDRQKLGE